MKVRISYSVDIPDWYRRRINAHYGRPGLASRQEIKSWFEEFGSSMDMDLGWDETNEEEEE
jgi:hypothetical protein